MGAGPKALRHQGQERVGHQREGDDDNRAADHLRVVSGLQALVEETAEAVVRCVGRQRRRRDHLERRRPHARRHEARRVRGLNLREHLFFSEPNCSRRVHGRARRRGDARVGRRQERRNRQDQECQSRCRQADTQPQARQRQDAERRNRAGRARRAHQPPAPARVPDPGAQRQCDEGRERHDQEGEAQVLGGPHEDPGLT